MTVIKCEYMYGSGIDGLWNDCNNLKSSVWTCPYAETGEFQKCKYSKLPTNADRIRSMTNEELAKFISGKARGFGEEYEGYMSALDWLQEPIEDE